MRMKRFAALLLALTTITTLAAVFAYLPAESVRDTAAESADITIIELQDRWLALSARQKKAVYKLFAQRGRAEIALMNEYAELGLVTAEEARVFSERVISWLDMLEDSGELPPIYGRMQRRPPKTPCPNDCPDCE